jgi:hypothetical protein
LKQRLARLFKFGGKAARKPGVTEEDHLRPDAAEALEAYASAHPALFERADRLRERAERTGSDGTPSESARLRAARAREEALAALTGVRASFVSRYGEGADVAFEREFDARYPVVSAGSSQDVIEP